MRNESPVTNQEPPMSQEGLDASYAAIREALEKNNRGNVVNSLQNCVLALTHDPLLGGHIRRNLFNERLTIEATLPWVRESSVISDTDLAFLQLHLERHYGLKAERCLPGAENRRHGRMNPKGNSRCRSVDAFVDGSNPDVARVSGLLTHLTTEKW